MDGCGLDKQVLERRAGRSAVGARGLAWPMLGRLGRLDPGSNPGGPTRHHEFRRRSTSD